MSDGPVALSYVIKDDAERLENLQASIWNSSATEGSDQPANHSNSQRFIATTAFRKYPPAEALSWTAASPLSRRCVGSCWDGGRRTSCEKAQASAASVLGFPMLGCFHRVGWMTLLKRKLDQDVRHRWRQTMVGLFVAGVETSLTCYKESELFITMKVSLEHHLFWFFVEITSRISVKYIWFKEHHEDLNSQKQYSRTNTQTHKHGQADKFVFLSVFSQELKHLTPLPITTRPTLTLNQLTKMSSLYLLKCVFFSVPSI